MRPIDLRSDTVTKPDAAMRAAMSGADVGDDVYGEDPTVNQLESEVASLLGHGAGLFTPSGSMANQLGLRLLVRPGQELLCDIDAHVVRAELGAAAVFSGITTRTLITRPPCKGRHGEHGEKRESGDDERNRVARSALHGCRLRMNKLPSRLASAGHRSILRNSTRYFLSRRERDFDCLKTEGGKRRE